MRYVNSIERIATRRGRQEGYQEGYQIGYQEGLEEVRLQAGVLRIVLKVCNHKFGPLEPTIETRISQLSSDQLQDLAVAIMDFKDKAELESWLQTNSGGDISQTN